MESTAESTIYLSGLLALLGLWLFHQMQVRSGRIQAIDMFDRSVVRFYVYVFPDDRLLCPICTEAQGRVFLPSIAEKNGFLPLGGPCRNTSPCQGYLIGLYGGWLEARQVVSRLQQAPKKSSIRLSFEELCMIVNGAWEQSVSADTDRISMHMLEGLCFGKADTRMAVQGLQYVVARARDARHLPLVVPAYLRLLDLLLKAGRVDEARQVIEQIEHRFPVNCHGMYTPSLTERKLLEEMKSLLWESQSLKVSA
jgi:hypothetical protein